VCGTSFVHRDRVRFAADGVAVNERTLLRWYADALKELRQAIVAAEDLGEYGVSIVEAD